MAASDELSLLGRAWRGRLQKLLAAVSDAETQPELMLYMERFFAIQTELRDYFSLVEGELFEKLRELHELEEEQERRRRSLGRAEVIKLRRRRHSTDLR
jgi:hypothetical protein